MFEVKPIAKDSIPRALERAERYRLLNEPRLAESICLDVLAIEPENQPALSSLLLSLTDQFGHGGGSYLDRAKQLLSKLAGEYEQTYYAGIIAERYGRQQLETGYPGAKFSAYDYMVDAMELYAKAEPMAPDGNDDALLRYNTCVRMIEWHGLTPRHADEHELPLE